LIDTLSGLQAEGVRFRVRIDPWAFCYDDKALSPWSRGTGRYELSHYDDSFWLLLRQIAECASDANVLVEVVLFNAATLRIGRGGLGWLRNPFNSVNGGPLTRDPAARFYNVPRPFHFELAASGSGPIDDDLRLQLAQESFVREAASRLEGLDNITWEISSQMEGMDPVRVGFVSHFVELLREVDTLDRVTTASVRTLRRADQDLYRLVGIDTVQFQLPFGMEPHKELIETVTALREFGKPVIAGEAEITSGYATIARSTVWQTYVAGGHPCAGPLLQEDEQALKAFVGFVEQTSPGAISPDGRLTSSRTEGLFCSAGWADDETVVLYATTEASPDSPQVGLKLPGGRWKATFVSPTSGSVLREDEIEAGRGVASLSLPAFEEDVAVRLVRLSGG
jgi:hypothetical protein